MPVSYDSFLEIAQDSMSKDGELWVRNAISRAYYSLYHSALQLTNGHIPETDSNGVRLSGGVHQRFANYLCDGLAASDFSLDKEEVKRVGLALKTAHHRRVISDYKLDKKINKLDAISTIQSAQEMALKINNLINSQKNAI